jgi:hypothetical protein
MDMWYALLIPSAAVWLMLAGLLQSQWMMAAGVLTLIPLAAVTVLMIAGHLITGLIHSMRD